MNLLRRRTPRRVLVVALILLIGLSIIAFFHERSLNESIDRAVNASNALLGETADQLIQRIGAPTVDRHVVPGDEIAFCVSDVFRGQGAAKRDGLGPNVRAIEYHVPDRGSAKIVWEWTGFGISSAAVVCLDKANRVTEAHYYFVN